MTHHSFASGRCIFGDILNPALSFKSFRIKRYCSPSPCPLLCLLDNEIAVGVAQHGGEKKEVGGPQRRAENDRKTYVFAFLLSLFGIISIWVKQPAPLQINGLMIQGNVELGS